LFSWALNARDPHSKNPVASNVLMCFGAGLPIERGRAASTLLVSSGQKVLCTWRSAGVCIAWTLSVAVGSFSAIWARNRDLAGTSEFQPCSLLWRVALMHDLGELPG